jgi:hypothetical protein
MDVLALILACSLYPDDALVRTMVDIQSGGNLLFVGDLVTLKTHDNLSSVENAMRMAEDIAQHGGRPALGLLGVPVEWGPRFGRDVRDLFDGCSNLEIGTAMFSQYAAECSPSRRQNADHVGGAQASRRSGRRPVVAETALRSCILTKLSRDLGLEGKPSAVLKRVARAGEDHAVVETTPPPQGSAVFADGTGDEDWSNPRLYFDPEQRPPPTAPALRPTPSLAAGRQASK